MLLASITKTPDTHWPSIKKFAITGELHITRITAATPGGDVNFGSINVSCGPIFGGLDVTLTHNSMAWNGNFPIDGNWYVSSLNMSPIVDMRVEIHGQIQDGTFKEI